MQLQGPDVKPEPDFGRDFAKALQDRPSLGFRMV